MKKILILIISVGLLFGLVGIGTHAYFSDVKTSSVSIFTSGVWDNPKAITAFSFKELNPAVVGVVNEDSHTVALTVPVGTDVKTLVPTIVFTGESVYPASGVAKDFTSPVTYTVTAADNTTQIYTVTVIAAQAALITAFSFQKLNPAVDGVVNEDSHTVALTVPVGTDVTTLVPTIVFTGKSVDPASGVAQDFTSPVTYTVTAADNTTQAYVATVTVNTAPDNIDPVSVNE